MNIGECVFRLFIDFVGGDSIPVIEYWMSREIVSNYDEWS